MADFDSSDLVLTIGSTQGGQSFATVTVAWCLSERLAAYLTRVEARDPQVLILVSDHGGTRAQQHQVVPLETGLTYVGLRHSGTNTIHATVVWRRPGEANPRRLITLRDAYTYGDSKWKEIEAKRKLCKRALSNAERLPESNPWHARFSEFADRLNREIESLYDQEQMVEIEDCISRVDKLKFESKIDVVVPKEMFAPEPNRVLKWLANYASGKRRVDQCETRKYAIFGALKLLAVIVLSPLAVVAIAAIELCRILGFLWFLFLGKRNLDWRALFTWKDPATLNGAWRNRKPSFWTHKKTSEKNDWDEIVTHYEERLPVFWLVNPPALAAIALITWAVLATSTPWVFVCAIVIAALIIGAVIYGTYLGTQDEAKVKSTREAKAQAKIGRQLNPLVYKQPQRNAVVAEELKPKRITVRLKFLETKSAVCRPYSE